MLKVNIEKITNGAVKTANVITNLAVAGAITLFAAALMKASLVVLFNKDTSDSKVLKAAKKAAKKDASKGNKA